MHSTLTIAEEKWLKTLVNINKEAFLKTHLPSHDHLHHSRVWEYAKDLLLALEENGERFTQEFIEQLIIAVFFHDLGMVKSTKPDHGFLGRQMAEKYLISQNLDIANYETALTAIERHDDKEYASASKKTNTTDVYTILTIADDLDAFGAIGVFRYLEIYYLRDIPLENMQNAINRNLEARFLHFSQRVSLLNELVLKHKQRKNLAISTLTEFNLKDITWIITQFKNKTNLNRFVKTLEESKNPSLINWSKNLKKELSTKN